jgi:hypothetical protein
MSLQIKKRGRPSKQQVQERELRQVPKRSDSEVLQDLKDRFTMLAKLTEGSLKTNIRSMVVSGAPGVGKTYTVETILQNTPGAHFDIVRGSLSAVNLYKLGYQYRRPGNVVVLDDADSIFTDEDALNILKALCDSSAVRRVHWLKESMALKEDDIPQSYEFHGSFIFISNLDFQKYVDMGGNKYVAHFEALMSRSLYLDLQLHDRQAISLWVEHIATAGKLFARENITPDTGDKILKFIKENRDSLRELSLRTLMKACGLAKSHPQEWERMAKVLLLKA